MTDVRVNSKLEGVNVQKLILEVNNHYAGEMEDWRLYVAKTGAGQPPIFLFQNGTGRVGLGTTDVFVKQLNLRQNSPGLPIEWTERTAYEFSQIDHALKRTYNAVLKPKSDLTWEDFAEETNDFIFYKIQPPVAEESLMELEAEEIENAIRDHIAGGFTLDPRVYAWGLGGLVRLPQNSKFVGWTKFRGHALIVKASKAGCSHVAARTTPRYDKVSPKSFEGYADVDGGVYYSPLHENFHAATLDEFGQLDDGIMVRLFAFMESGVYDTVKASRRIINKGNCRISFITNPPSMTEGSFGQTFAVDSMMNAYFDCLYKLTQGNFEGGMSRFGLVIVSKNVETAKGKEIPQKKQDYANAVATSVFEVIAPKVAKVFEDEQTQAWLSQKIEHYNDGINALIAGFDDVRLKRAWWGQTEAYRHVRGAALEIAIAENAYAILHNSISVDELIQEADAVLEDVVEWNLVSLREIVAAANREETEEMLVARLRRAKPNYVVPILTAMCLSDSGDEVDLEAAYDSLPRPIRDALEPDRFYCWSHISSRIKQPGALRRLSHALAGFGAVVVKVPKGLSFAFDRADRTAKIREGLILGKWVKREVFATSSIDDVKRDFGSRVATVPNSLNVPPTSAENQGQLGTVRENPPFSKDNCPQLSPEISDVRGTVGPIGTVKPPKENLNISTSDADVKMDLNPKRVVFRPGGYDLVGSG